MKVHRAYLSGIKNGDPVEVDNPKDVQRLAPNTTYAALTVIFWTVTQLAFGYGYPTKPMLFHALNVLSTELETAFLMVSALHEEWEATLTLELTDTKARAEVEAGNGIVFSREEVGVDPSHLTGCPQGEG